MNTLLITHAACLAHDVPFGHPESPDRLRAVLHALEGEDFAYLHREDAPEAPREAIERVHPPAFVDSVLDQIPAELGEFRHFDPDTVVSAGSREAALRAAGAVIAGVDAVMEAGTDNAFCAVRPPGHHAERERAMGFCLFNNAAVGALHARALHGLERVAVVDFDVHHGNGTQDLAEADPGLFYASIHQGKLYPFTGHPHETGPAQNVVNATVPEGADSTVWRRHFESDVIAPLDAYRPDLIIVSAGFDAHAHDPLAGLNLTNEDFHWATRVLMGVADRHAAGRLVSTLEGGYDLRALADSARAHVRALMGA